MVHNLVHNLCESLVTNIGNIADTGKRTHPTPITYLTKWKIVGNSEVHGSEIWSCGEYNPIDGKYHILVQPQGGSIADIALTEPLRKVNDVADTIEFPSDTEGKALVTRCLGSNDLGDLSYSISSTAREDRKRIITGDISTKVKRASTNDTVVNLLSAKYLTVSHNQLYSSNDNTLPVMSVNMSGTFSIFDPDYNPPATITEFRNAVRGMELIYELATPITELVDAPQIEEADSYTCVISQGAKAVSWSSFTTE